MTFHIKLGMLNVLSHVLLDHLRRLVESDQKPMTTLFPTLATFFSSDSLVS
jgi:hypothetical protein